MKNCTYIILIILWSSLSYAQLVNLADTTSVEQFVLKNKPNNSVLTHKVIVTKWNSIPIIAAFYNQTYKLALDKDPDQQDYSRIVGRIFVEFNNKEFTELNLDIYDSEGGDPIIETLFFANADKDQLEELIVIVSWEQRHYDISGTLYGTFIYDNLEKVQKENLKFLADISEKLNGGCECDWRNGKSKKAKYKTASEIKKKLRKLGYK